MLKYIAPLEQRLRHLQRPAMFTAHRSQPTGDMTTGQRVAEQAAAGIGSWGFIGAQAIVMAVWIVFNSLAITHALHFDPGPFIALNLAMSAEAAFTGPLLLIAANVGATRDHRQADRMEAMEKTLLEDNALLRGSVDALRSEIAQLTAQKEAQL